MIGKLREADVVLSTGKTIHKVVRERDLTKQTYCRWKREYSDLRTDHFIPPQEYLAAVRFLAARGENA